MSNPFDAVAATRSRHARPGDAFAAAVDAAAEARDAERVSARAAFAAADDERTPRVPSPGEAGLGMAGAPARATSLDAILADIARLPTGTPPPPFQ